MISKVLFCDTTRVNGYFIRALEAWPRHQEVGLDM